METNLAIIDERLTKEINPIIGRAMAITVKTVAEKEVAVVERNLISDLIKVVIADFEKPKGSTYKAWKDVVAQEKGHLDPLETAKRTIGDKIGTFDLDMKRLREKEETEALAEAQRLFDIQVKEAQGRIDEILAGVTDIDETIELLNMELKREDLADVQRQKLESQLETQYALKENNQEKAAEIQARAAEPVFTAPRLVVPDTKVKGASCRFELMPQVVNKMALIKAVANGTVPDTVLDVNMGALKKYVNMMKRATPGVSFTEKAVVSGRSR